ncbi:MAG: hypothetical protein AAFV95_07130 [Bacteroidota bacterium]
MKKKFLFSCLLLLCTLFVWAQAPIDNPYSTTDEKHWTNDIQWDKVTDAASIKGLLHPNFGVDSALLHQTMNNISKAGGGILYFPRGLYYFTTDINIPSGVIIRGAKPEFGEKVIQEDTYLPTRFIFPLFSPEGTDYVAADFQNEPGRTTITKMIRTGKKAARKIGLIHLDINRGIINLSNKDFDETITRKGIRKSNSSIVLLGLRINNATVHDPAIPSQFQIDRQNQWQRWPWKYAANVNITAAKNVIIADCRINDQPTDNYRQNNYILNDGMTFDGYEAEFKVTDHPGIAINHPMTVGTKSGRPIGSIELIDNHIRITKGHKGIIFPTASLDPQRTNTIEIIDEPENIVFEGREVKTFDYNIIYRNAEALSSTVSYITEMEDTLSYRIIPPAKVAEGMDYPLIVFLHDYTSKGSDNRSQLRHFVWQMAEAGVRKQFPCYIVAPQLPHSEDLWRAKFNFSLSWPLYATNQIVSELAEQYQIDEDRIYLVGAGVGADAIWDMGIYYPERYAAMVNLGGFYHFTPISAKQISHIPVWSHFGAEDEWLPTHLRQVFMHDIRMAGINATFTTAKRTGKKCWNQVIAKQPDLLPWLFSQRRSDILSTSK